MAPSRRGSPRALGDDGALAVYERLLRGTLDAAEQVPGAALVLAEAPAAAAAGRPRGAGRARRRRRRRADPLAGRTAAGRGCGSAATDSASGSPPSSADLFAERAPAPS